HLEVAVCPAYLLYESSDRTFVQSSPDEHLVTIGFLRQASESLIGGQESEAAERDDGESRQEAYLKGTDGFHDSDYNLFPKGQTVMVVAGVEFPLEGKAGHLGRVTGRFLSKDLA